MRWILVPAALACIALPATGQASGRAGTTTMTFSNSHGTQVEYLARDGNAYLWYPGNSAVLHGHWRISTAQLNARPVPGICFQYGANTYNPATGEAGGHWECEPYAIYRAHLVEQSPTDLFKLGTRTQVPFVLPAERTSLSDLRSKL